MQTKKIFIILLSSGLLLGALFFLKYQNQSKVTFEKGNLIKEQNSQIDHSEENKDSVINSSLEQGSVTENEKNLSLQEQKQLKTIYEILNSKNDNDPRIDSELKNLSFNLKENLMLKYKKMKPEMLNEKGFLAFLVSREAQHPEDLDLLMTVFEDSPCLSLADCSFAEKQVDPHHSENDNVTLNYPQLSTLYQIEQKLNTNSLSPSMKNEYKSFLIKAANYPVDTVSNKAKSIIKKYNL